MNKSVQDLIIAAGIPEGRVAERHFSKPVSLPYAVYYEIRDTYFTADDVIYSANNHITIEIYMDGYVDSELIENMQKQLDEKEIIYDISNDYVADENLCIVVFDYYE